MECPIYPFRGVDLSMLVKIFVLAKTQATAHNIEHSDIRQQIAVQYSL